MKLFKNKFPLPDTLCLGIILLSGLLIRAYRIEEPFGGFQAFNEGFYAFLAKEYFNGSLLYPKTWDSGIDYMIPPFHSYWMFFLNKLFGVSEAVDRWASVIPSMLTLYVVFLLGKRLFNSKVGLIATGLLAFIPMNVVVGRNVQVDSTYIFFALCSLYFYLRSLETHKLRDSSLSGVSLGLSLFSKQFAVLMYPAIMLWELYRSRDFRWIDRRFFTFLTCSLVIPTPFYLYHILFNSEEFWRIQKSQSEILHLPNLSLLKLLNAEAFWGLTPLVYFLGGLSVVWFLLRRKQTEGLLLILLGVYLGFYLCTYKHSYYLLMVAPILSLMIGKFLYDQLKSPAVLEGVFALILGSLLFFSGLTLAGNKYGQKAFKEAGTYLEGIERDGYYLIVAGHILGAYGPVIRYYAPSGIIINWDESSFFEGETGELKIKENKPIYVLEPFRETSHSSTRVFYNEFWAWTLWGKVIYQVPLNHHFFAYKKIEIKDSGDPKLFGLSKIGEFPVISVVKLPEHVKVYRDPADFATDKLE